MDKITSPYCCTQCTVVHYCISFLTKDVIWVANVLRVARGRDPNGASLENLSRVIPAQNFTHQTGLATSY